MAELTLEQKRAIAIAKARARAAKTDQQPTQQPQRRGTFDRTMRGVGGGITDLVGFVPGAAMELGNLTGLTDFEDTSGSNFLKRQLEPLGFTGAPGEDLGTAGRIGEAVGQYGLPGVAGTAALARRGASLITGASRAPAAGAGARILDDMAAGAARAPVATGAAEVTAAAGEATGREAAGGMYGEGWQQDVGGLIGGIIGGLGPSGAAAGTRRVAEFASDNIPAVGLVRRAGQRLFRVKASPGDRRRAGQRLRELAEGAVDDGDAIPALQNLRNTADVDPDLLTPAQQTGDAGIMSLAARERADEPARLAGWRAQVEDNMLELRNRLKNVTGDEVERIQRQYGQEVDDMVVVAAANAERRLANMTPTQRRSEASTVLRGELDRAYRTARGEESALWDMVPDDMVMPAETVRQRFIGLKGQLSQENAEDMPQKALQFLDPDSPQSYYRVDADGELLTDTVPLKRLQNLRSALLNEARNASSGSNPNRNRARLARELADGLLDDMASVDPRESPGTGAFLAAKNFSRHLNDRFTRGPVGDVLQTKARGDASISPEATLDRTIGRGGVEAERATRAFTKALKSPNEEVRGAFVDFMKDEFQRKAMRDGQFNPAGARSFMNKYQDLFGAQPQLRQMFDQAIQDGNLTAVAGSIQDGAARVLGKNNPAAEIRRIRQMADADPSGAVWASFRKGLTNELLERARVRNPRGDIDGEILSGSVLNELLDGEKVGPALKQAFNKTELANLRRIANTAQRIERDIGARQATSFATSEPNVLARLIAGYSGALGGAAASRAAGGGAAGLRSAALGSKFVESLLRKSTRVPVEKLLHRALSDKQVMDDLLTPMTKPGFDTQVAPRINAWLVGVIDEMDLEEDGVEPGQPRPREMGRRPGPPPDLPQSPLQ